MLRLTRESDLKYRLNSEDWTDGDYNDFIVTIERIIEETPQPDNPEPVEDTQVPPRFDEWHYRAVNQDVDDAVLRGEFKSGLHHFRMFGKNESRSTQDLGKKDEFDSKGYLATYSDVAEAVEAAQFKSAQHHYVLLAFLEH